MTAPVPHFGKIDKGGGLVARLCPTLATPWTIAHQASLPMGFPRQEYWSGLLFPIPRDLPNPGIEPGSLVLRAVSCIAGRFFADWATREATPLVIWLHKQTNSYSIPLENLHEQGKQILSVRFNIMTLPKLFKSPHVNCKKKKIMKGQRTLKLQLQNLANLSDIKPHSTLWCSVHVFWMIWIRFVCFTSEKEIIPKKCRVSLQGSDIDWEPCTAQRKEFRAFKLHYVNGRAWLTNRSIFFLFK